MRLSAASALAALCVGCSTVAPMSREGGFGGGSAALTPAKPPSHRIAFTLTPGPELSEPAAENCRRLPFDEELRRRLSQEVARALAPSSAGEPIALHAIVDVKASPSADELPGLCKRAEEEGADVLFQIEVTGSELVYEGSDGAYAADLILLLTFPPFHIWIPDERFTLRRRLRVRAFDVRAPSTGALPELDDVEGLASDSFDELDHGYIFLNPIRSWWTGAERFEAQHWEAVEERLRGEADRALMSSLAATVSEASGRLEEEVSRSEARLHGIFVGQKGEGRFWASDDATRLEGVFRAALKSQGKRYLKVLGGALAPPTREALLDKIRGLNSRSGDRLLLSIAGRMENGALQMKDGPLGLKELLDALFAQPLAMVWIVLDVATPAGEPPVIAGETPRGRRWRLWTFEERGRVIEGPEARSGDGPTGALFEVLRRVIAEAGPELDYPSIEDRVRADLPGESSGMLGGDPLNLRVIGGGELPPADWSLAPQGKAAVGDAKTEPEGEER